MLYLFNQLDLSFLYYLEDSLVHVLKLHNVFLALCFKCLLMLGYFGQCGFNILLNLLGAFELSCQLILFLFSSVCNIGDLMVFMLTT